MVVKPPPKNREIENCINKGAKVVSDNKEVKIEWQMINIRIPSNLLKLIDENKKERYGLNRTQWILESILEKLNKNN